MSNVIFQNSSKKKYIGSNQVKKIYLGNNLVYTSAMPTYGDLFFAGRDVGAFIEKSGQLYFAGADFVDIPGKLYFAGRKTVAFGSLFFAGNNSHTSLSRPGYVYIAGMQTLPTVSYTHLTLPTTD